MPISSPAVEDSRDGEAGFSLVELLAVLAIMSLMVGAVVMSLPDARTTTDVRTETLAVQLQEHLDAAALAGEMRVIGVDVDGLSLFRDRGAIITQDARWDWPENARISVLDGEERVKLADEPAPDYWIEPYGDVPDLAITLRGPDATYRIGFDDRGRVSREAVR